MIKSVFVQVFLSDTERNSDNFAVSFESTAHGDSDLELITQELRRTSKLMDVRLQVNDPVFKQHHAQFGMLLVMKDTETVYDGSMIVCVLHPKVLLPQITSSGTCNDFFSSAYLFPCKTVVNGPLNYCFQVNQLTT